MNICKYDIYFIIFTILMLYVLYKIEFCNKEKFQSTTSGYQADVEAIRNLSSIASQITSNNTLTMPGALNITNELSVKTGDPGKQVKIGSSQIKFRGDGIVHYGLTNDKDGKFKISNLSGSGDVGSGWVNDCIITDPNGNTTINGNLSTKEMINVTNNTSEGGRVSIRNSLKNGKAGQTNDWSIWNMTGEYGNKLAFWRYNGDGVNAGPLLELYDNGSVKINGSLTADKIIKRTQLYLQRINNVTITNEYTITHNLNIPLHLLTIKVFAYYNKDWYDITGQLINSGYNHSYIIKVVDSNSFKLIIGKGCVMVGLNPESCPSYGVIYDIYII